LADSPVIGSVVTAIFQSSFWFTVVLKWFLCLWLFHKVGATERQQIVMILLKLWIAPWKGKNAMLATRINSWIQFIWQFKEGFGTKTILLEICFLIKTNLLFLIPSQSRKRNA